MESEVQFPSCVLSSSFFLLTLNMLVSVVISNSSAIPVRIEQNIAKVCFGSSYIKSILIVDRGRKTKSKFLLECVQAKHGEPCLSVTSNP